MQNNKTEKNYCTATHDIAIWNVTFELTRRNSKIELPQKSDLRNRLTTVHSVRISRSYSYLKTFCEVRLLYNSFL